MLYCGNKTQVGTLLVIPGRLAEVFMEGRIICLMYQYFPDASEFRTVRVIRPVGRSILIFAV